MLPVVDPAPLLPGLGVLVDAGRTELHIVQLLLLLLALLTLLLLLSPPLLLLSLLLNEMKDFNADSSFMTRLKLLFVLGLLAAVAEGQVPPGPDRYLLPQAEKRELARKVKINKKMILSK